MSRQQEDGPFTLERARPQVADDYTPQYAGSGVRSGEDRSPWYTPSGRYYSDASCAAKVRKIEEQRQREAAERRRAYLERRGAVAVGP